jgi:hypothetical protein
MPAFVHFSGWMIPPPVQRMMAQRASARVHDVPLTSR